MIPKTLMDTNLQIEGLNSKYTGKVREVYHIQNDLLLMVATDRLSAFDVVMPKGIPYKGQILNQIANQMLKATSDIVPNWLEATPDPNVSIGISCKPFRIEMVIRGYLSGHAARTYKKGDRVLCGVRMQEGMNENDRFDIPIITPSTKAEEGHDEDISREEIISKGIVNETDYNLLEKYTKQLFERGSEIAKKQGLILVDTKYEFGKKNDQIYLIDEIHTPDSSRYFYKEGYENRQLNGKPQKQLSKEFVREWLMENGFQGKHNQNVPFMNNDFVDLVTNRYIELYEKVSGLSFKRANLENTNKRIEMNVLNFLSKKD